MVKLPLTLVAPVLKDTLSGTENCTEMLLGSDELQDPPPPVHEEAANVWMVCETDIDGVSVPEHAVPKLMAVH
jgi:hypothetical protein